MELRFLPHRYSIPNRSVSSFGKVVMMFRCVILVFTIGVSVNLLSSTCEAQWRVFNQTIQKPGRLTGHGWGAGYHWKSPGHDSSYYNPYSHHNSFRASDWQYGIPGSPPQGTHYLAPTHSVLIVSQPLKAVDADQAEQLSDSTVKRETPSSEQEDIEREGGAEAKVGEPN
jgi:hypothetical protein